MTTSNKKAILGVDLGGTNIRVGKVVNNSIIKTISEKLPEDKDTNANFVINTIINTISPLEDDAVGIGIGIGIGSGIGGGIINNGSLLKDVNCGSGEFGEMKYLDARYEDYCSSLFFKKKYNIDGFDLYNMALSGDSKALEIFKTFGFHLGNMIKTVIFALDPEAIILGASIAGSNLFFEEAMWNELKDFTYPKSIEKLTIEYSNLENNAQRLGAATLYIDGSK